jgi:hypothetical protein
MNREESNSQIRIVSSPLSSLYSMCLARINTFGYLEIFNTYIFLW